MVKLDKPSFSDFAQRKNVAEYEPTPRKYRGETLTPQSTRPLVLRLIKDPVQALRTEAR